MTRDTEQRHPVVLVLSYLFLLALSVMFAGCAYQAGVSGAGEPVASPLNAVYLIDGSDEPVTLVNGRAEMPAAAGSAAVVTTSVWGQPTRADLSGDGREAAALILLQDHGGSGAFYYLAVAERGDDGFRGVDSAFLGDRIRPERVTVEGNRIVVDFFDREEGAPMSALPTRRQQRTFTYDVATQRLMPLMSDFEGEANPARISLTMKTWVWQRTRYNDDRVETPTLPEAFTITFTADQRVQITTDCNSLQGAYETRGDRLGFSMLMGTLRHCEDAQEETFARDLQAVNGYLFTGRGTLVLELRYDSGSMIFQ